jgi:cellulase/cellobiase CelA1
MALAALLLTLVTPGIFAQVTHVSNPYEGAVGYVSSDYAKEVASAIAVTSSSATNPSYPSYNLQEQMETVAHQPAAIWMDRIAAITATHQDGSSTGGKSLDALIQEALTQGTTSKPVVMEIVIYDLPDRDCAAAASNGELSIAGSDIPNGGTTALTDANGNTETGIEEYEYNYITPIYNILAKYSTNAAIRFVLVVEDDSLPNLITNTGIDSSTYPYTKSCTDANGGVANTSSPQNWTATATPDLSIPSTGVYYQGIAYALNQFHKLPNVYNYLDVGHHGWLGWTANMAYAVQFFRSFATTALTDGYATIDGFITNTANYGPTLEPYLEWDMLPGGTISATNQSSDIFTGNNFYQWNPEIDELTYSEEFYAALTASVSAGYTDPRGQAHTPGGGFPTTIGFLIDTSRNGWGNLSASNGGGLSTYTTRPTAMGTSTNLDTFVNESKIDLRNSSGQWCNQENAGIGALPTFASSTDTNTGYYTATTKADGTVIPAFPNLEALVWIKPPGESDGNYPGSEYYDPITGITSPASTVGDKNCNPTTDNPLAGANTEVNSIPNSPSAGTFWIAQFTQLVQNAYPVLAQTPISTTPTFTLAPSASTLSVIQGKTATDTITVTDVDGFTDSVTFAVSGLPSGVTASFSPTSSTSSSSLTLTASDSATVGTSTITITGTSGSITTTTTFTLAVVSSSGGFTLAPSASTLSDTQGKTATDTITVTDISPFSGSVTFAASGLPSGVTASFSPASSTSSSTVTFTASSSATAGTSTVTITGTSGSLTASTTISLTVNSSSSSSVCSVTYTISPQNSNAFGAALTINNTSSTAWTSWTLTWTFANGQTISSLWNGIASQSGANVTVANESYNGSIAAGGSSTGIGFNGAWNGTTNAVPTNFAVNGTSCGGGGGSSPTATTTTLSSSTTSTTTGTSVTLTAAVSPTAATGTVTFYDGTTSLGTGTISSGTATLSTSFSTTGTHSIAAVYAGSSTYATSTSSAVSISVTSSSPTATTTALSSSTTSTTTGTSVTLTAAVSPSAATGAVTFYDGTTSLGTGTLSSGVATLSTSFSTAGTHSITAVYAGSSTYATSTSSALSISVMSSSPTATTTALSSSSTSTTTGTSVTLTAAVSPSAATGTVTFYDGSTLLGTGTLSSGKATLSTSFSTAGTHSITAVYAGSSTYATSTSSAVSITVSSLTSTTTTLSSSTTAPKAGASFTLTATVSPSAATGTVTFYNGTTLLGTGTLSSGVATLSTSIATAGTYSLTAVYAGSSTYATSTSSAVSVTISSTTASSCTVDYTISPQNTSQFGAAISIVNNSSTAWTGWTLTWTFANGQTISNGNLWNGIASQSGANVTVTNQSYNGSVAAGGSSTGIGFNGTWNGTTNAVPTNFAVNGTACTVN